MDDDRRITITTRDSDDGKSSIEIFPSNQEDYMKTCPICYEEILPSLNDISAIAVLSGCNHRFCRPCMLQHCEHSVVDKNIPILCPYHGAGIIECKNVISDVQVHSFLCSNQDGNHDWQSCQLSSTWIKYNRCQQMQRNPFLAPCPKCDSLVTSAVRNQTLQCPCGHSFCSLHGDAHHGVTCREFQKAREAESRQEKLSRAAIKKFTKPCSHCDVPIEKEAGCDHIICPQCKQDFCFKCGTHEYLSGEGTVRHCSKCDQRYLDHRKLGRHRFYMCLQLPIMIPFSILYTAAMIIFFIASCFFCFCFGCGSMFNLGDADADDSEDVQTRRHMLMPFKAIQATLGCLLLPWAEFLESFGLSCCETMLNEFCEEVLREKRRQQDDDNSEKTTEMDIDAI